MSQIPRSFRRLAGAAVAVAMTVALVIAGPPSAHAADTSAPTVPSDFGGSINCALVLTLHWSASTDDVGVAGYDVFRSVNNEPFAFVRTTPATTFSESLQGIAKYQVRARDAAGNISAFTAPASIIPPPCPAPADRQAPTTPGAISISVSCPAAVTLNWGASTDNVAVIGYDVYRSLNNGPFTSVATTPTTTFTEPMLGIVQYEVRARDTSANVSAFTAAVTVVPPPCPAPDTQPPTTPGTPIASGATRSSTTLTWAPSTDNIHVTGYDIYRATAGGTFAQVGTAATNSFTDTGLAPRTTYRYQVRARDAAGNVSAFSAAVTITTRRGSGLT